MSLSKKHKAYKATGGKLGFAEWVTLYDRLASARAARGKSVSKRKARVVAAVARDTNIPMATVKAPTEYVRVEHRVDCFGVTRHGVTLIGADARDGKRVAKLVGGRVVSTYTSKRGERARIECMGAVNVRKLTAAGFTPKGF